MSESHDHKLGRLEGEVNSLKQERERLLDALESITVRLTAIEKTLASASGSWRTLVAIGALISVVSGAFGAWFSHK